MYFEGGWQQFGPSFFHNVHLGLAIFNIFLPSVVVKERRGSPPFHMYVLGLGSKELTLCKNTR
jgi:hypothetical protein